MAYGLWLNQKGKVLADSFVLRETPESLWVVSFSSKAAVIRERLESYIIADDVVIEDVTEQWSGLAVGGAGGSEWLVGQVGGALPVAGEFLRTADGFVFRGRRGANESWEWLRPAGAALPEGLTPLSAEEVERALLQGETRVGELRSAVADGAGGFIGLALVTTLRLDVGSPLAPEPGGNAYIRLIDTP